MLDRNTDTDQDETEVSPERKTYEQTDNYIETDRETDIHAERGGGGERREDEDRETGNERERWRERQIGQKQEPLSGHQKGQSSFSVHLVKEVKH